MQDSSITSASYPRLFGLGIFRSSRAVNGLAKASRPSTPALQAAPAGATAALPAAGPAGCTGPAGRTGLAGLAGHAGFEIPATFTEPQVEWILALHRLARFDRPRALQILGEFAPERCTLAQAVCIAELFSLGTRDVRATLVDAMEDGPLRQRMRAQADALDL